MIQDVLLEVKNCISKPRNDLFVELVAEKLKKALESYNLDLLNKFEEYNGKLETRNLTTIRNLMGGIKIWNLKKR